MKKLTLLLVFAAFCIISNAQLLGGSSIEKYEMIGNDSLQKRTELLLFNTCLNVIGEDTTGVSTTVISKRHSLATKIIANQANLTSYRNMLVRALLSAPGVTINLSSSDSDIQFGINSVFNDLAGVKFDD